MVSVYCFDLDETLCHTNGTDYSSSIPNQLHINKVNKLFEEGNYIKIFTARGSETKINWREVTIYQLDLWKVQYHELILGKPAADFYIDDKAINSLDFDWEP